MNTSPPVAVRYKSALEIVAVGLIAVLILQPLFPQKAHAAEGTRKALDQSAATAAAVAAFEAYLASTESTSARALAPFQYSDSGAQSSSMAALSAEDLGTNMSQFDVASYARNAQVSGASGAFTYEIPVQTPPGRSGMEPSIALAYSSQNGEEANIAGYGWDIPIPAITRANVYGSQTLHASPTYVSSLSGELATTSDPTLFLARADDGSNLRYALATTTDGWRVTDKKGTVYTFGASAAARQDDPSNNNRIYRWLLEKVEDTNGNYVTYEYFKDSGFVYPSRITYTHHPSQPGVFSIDFNRESRTDIATSTSGGFPAVSKYRIDEIIVATNGSWSRKYDLAYVTGDNGRRSLLHSVTESGQSFDTGSSVTASLPPSTFTYSTSTQGWATTTAFSLPQKFVIDTVIDAEDVEIDSGTRIFDVNSDALPDIVRAQQATSTLVYLNTGSGWTLSSAWTFPDHFTNNEGMDLGTRLADVNGDGKTDVVRSGDGIYQTYLNTGSGFATTTSWVPSIAFSTDIGDPGTRLADINGDGLPDLLNSYVVPTENWSSYEVRLNNGVNGWTSASSWVVPVYFSEAWLVGGGAHYRTHQSYLVEVNGDGLTDIISYDNNFSDQNGVYLNTGSGWQRTTAWSIPAFNGDAHQFTDINGDQLVDIVTDMGESRFVYLNTGSGWVSAPGWVVPIELEGWSGLQSHVVDVDGDGLPDMLRRTDTEHVRLLNRTKPVDMLTHVDQSTGSEQSVTYASSAKLKAPGGTVANPRVPFVLHVVATTTQDDGLGNTAATGHHFSDGQFYFATPRDRLFAGFGTVRTIDPQGDLTTTYFHQGNESATSTGEYNDLRSKIGRVYRTESFDQGGNLYARTVRKWDHKDRSGTADFVTLVRETKMAYDGDVDHRDTAETYTHATTTGNLIEKVSWGEVSAAADGSFTDTGSDKVKETTEYAINTAGTIPGLPSRVTINENAGIRVRETRHLYDNLPLGELTLGNRTKESLWRSGSNFISTNYAYNAYGLPTSITDPRANVTTISYDPYQLYQATTTNALSQATRYGYDYSSGKLAWTRDPYGYKATTLYDPFDRVLQQRVPRQTNGLLDELQTQYAYTDTQLPRRVQKTDYLSSATSSVSYLYLDGHGRTVEERKEHEDGYSVRAFAYSPRGELATESLPYLATGTTYAGIGAADEALQTSYEHDALGRVTSVSNVLGSTVTAYDQWMETTTDPLQNVRTLSRDAYGNIARIEEKPGSTVYATSYTYDPNGRLLSLTDGLGNVRAFTYDGLGRRLSAQDLHAPADSTYGTWTYAYDAAGNLDTRTDPKGQVVSFTYDALNRPLTENFQGVTGTEVTYGYDSCTGGLGRLCSATSTGATVRYVYNPRGFTTSETRVIAGVTYTTTYTYDRAGNYVTIGYPDNATIKYFHDASGRIDAVSRKQGSGAYAPVVTNIDYAPTGQISSKVYANGVTSTYTFDPDELYRLRSLYTAGATSSPLGMALESQELLLLAQELFIAEEPVVEETGAEDVIPSEVLLPEEPSEATSSEPLPVLPVETIATTTPELSVPETEQFIATTTPAVATSTPEQVELPILLSLDLLPGNRPTDGSANLDIRLLGKTEEGDEIYQASVYAADTYYEDPLTGARAMVDLKLVPEKGGWSMQKAGYGVRLGRAANKDMFAYRAGGLGFSMSVASTTGRAAKERDGLVLYEDGVAPGVDVEIALSPSALRKDAIIRNQEASARLRTEGDVALIPFLLTPESDLTLSFADGHKLSEGESITTGDMVTLTGADGSAAYILPPVVRDASGRNHAIEIRYTKTETGILLEKRVPLVYLSDAIYPLRTDAVISLNPNTTRDGCLYSTSSNWSTARNATTGSVSCGANGATVGIYKTGNQYEIYRVALPFDTSGLPDNALVTGAVLRMYMTGRDNMDDDGNDFIRVVQTTTASGTSLTAEDFDQIGAVTNPTGALADKDLSDLYPPAYWGATFATTSLSWINPTGHTKLGLREGHDIQNVAPDAASTLSIYLDAWGEHLNPATLDITYVLPATPNAPTDLRVEDQANPTDVLDLQPEFSAVYHDPDAGDIATHYRLMVTTDPNNWNAPLWSTAKLALTAPVAEGARSEQISYDGPPLQSGITYYWRIRFFDESGAAGSWSSASMNTFALSENAVPTPIFRSMSSSNWSYFDGGAFTDIPKPAGLAVGDLMIAAIPVDTQLGSAPSGWTTLESALNVGSRVGLRVYGKIADTNDVAVTTSYRFYGGSYALTGAILRIENADLLDRVSSLVYKSTTNTNPITFSPGLTPSEDESLLVAIFHLSGGDDGYFGQSVVNDDPVWSERLDAYTTYDTSHMWSVATAQRTSATSTGAFSVNATASDGSRQGYGLLLSLSGNALPLAPSALYTEGQTNPTSVIDLTPEFSAVYEDLDTGDQALAYQIQVSTSTAFTNLFWDTGRTAMATTTEGGRSADVSYAGPALVPDTVYYWRIRFWDDNQAQGAWSDPENFFYSLSGATSVLQDMTYTYDAVGNIVRIDDHSGTAAAKLVTYGYDGIYRLTGAQTLAASSTPFTHAYAYNAIGNMTSSNLGAYAYAGTGYTNPHAPTSIAGTALSYDNNGNLTAYGTTTYAWDYRNRLSSSGGSTFAYDHADSRVQKISGGVTTTYTDRLYTTDGTTRTEHLYAGDDLLATVDRVGSNTTVHYAHPDHLGSLNVSSNISGAADSVMDYYPYGSTRVDTGSFNGERGYIGERTDAESGLSYLNARYYDGARGQFLSQDPSFLDIGSAGFEQEYERKLQQHLMNPQALNSYSYALNNPIINKDPEGEIVPLLLAGWAAAEIGLSAYDAYNAYQTANDPGATQLEKSVAVGGFVAGLYAPGGGYGGAGKALVGQSFGKAGTVIENSAGKINSFYRSYAKDPYHGLNQTINRGVSPKTLLDTVKNPLVTLKQAGGNVLRLTNEAGVVLDKSGNVVTTYTKNQFLPHIKNILNKANNK